LFKGPPLRIKPRSARGAWDPRVGDLPATLPKKTRFPANLGGPRLRRSAGTTPPTLLSSGGRKKNTKKNWGGGPPPLAPATGTPPLPGFQPEKKTSLDGAGWRQVSLKVLNAESGREAESARGPRPQIRARGRAIKAQARVSGLSSPDSATPSPPYKRANRAGIHSITNRGLRQEQSRTRRGARGPPLGASPPKPNHGQERWPRGGLFRAPGGRGGASEIRGPRGGVTGGGLPRPGLKPALPGDGARVVKRATTFAGGRRDTCPLVAWSGPRRLVRTIVVRSGGPGQVPGFLENKRVCTRGLWPRSINRE